MKSRSTIAPWITLLLLTTLVTPVHAQARKTATKHSLWQIEGKTNSTYLFGSIHFLKKEFYPLAQPIEDAYKQAQVVVLEVDMKEMEAPETQIKMLEAGKYPAGQTLKQQVSKDTYARLEAHLADSGAPATAFDPLRPWMVAVALVGVELQKLGFDPEEGVDKYFFTKATKDKKQIVPLETVDLQIGLFKGFTPQQEDAMLKETLQEISKFKTDIKTIVDAWKAGDTKALDGLMLEAMRDYPELYKKLLVDRNKQWAEKLQKLHAGGKNVFVVVGTAHLVGKESLVELLSAKGLKIRQL
jgi:uncharacterized protein